jgi:hypothetical protein
MFRRLHFVLCIVLVAVASVPAHGADSISVSGTVRDSAGVPQIGAVVQLLSPDMSVVSIAYTDGKGRYTIASVLPGRYSLKAMDASFIPSLRENLRIRTNTVVNLTLNTLYEVIQWLPVQPRDSNASKDDWAWTLRSAANRPLLRWLEDGPLVVVSDGSGSAPRLKARLMATGKDGSFGESGQRISVTLEEVPSSSSELMAQVDFDPESDAGMESMLGFTQDLGLVGSVQSVAAVAIHPEIAAGDTAGLSEVAIHNSESMNFGDDLFAEVGSEEVLARFGQQSPDTIVTALPFVTAGWRNGNSTIRYGMATSLPSTYISEGSEAGAWLPKLSMRDGELALEHGMHQQIGWERRTDASSIAMLVYSDHIENPVLEAMSHSDAGGPGISALMDRKTGILRLAGPDYSTTGVMASAERKLPANTQMRISYANGDAISAPGPAQAKAAPQDLSAAFRPRRAQMYALSLSGTIEGTGTRWRASYRWQPEDTVTPVAPYSEYAAEPWLNLHMRQPIYLHGFGADHIELLFDVHNLLAEGYHPVYLNNGSLLVFAQDQRGFQGGLAFTF